MSIHKVTLATLTTVCALAGGLLFASAPVLAASTHPYLSSFDGSELMEGSFAHPEDVAINQSTHDVYVLDQFGGFEGQGAVDVFDEAGKFVMQFTGAETPQGSLQRPDSIAVDNSGTASEGHIYVTANTRVYAFDGTGKFLYELNNESVPGGVLGAIGVTVDSTGTVYVSSAQPTTVKIAEFTSAGKFLGEVASPALARPQRLVVTAAGDIYALLLNGRVAEFTATGVELHQLAAEGADSLALDPVTRHVFVGFESTIREYDENGAFVSQFGAPHLESVTGLAIDASKERIVVADSGEDDIALFGPEAPAPEATTGPCTNATASQTELTLTGTVNPESATLPATYQFEYGETSAYGSLSPAEAASVGVGTAPVPVSAPIMGLSPNTTYHYRLVAEDANGRVEGIDRICTTPGAPAITSNSVTAVTATEAELHASVTPNGTSTSVQFEYGLTTAYELGSLPTHPIDLGSSYDPQAIAEPLSGLAPATTYHFRATAISAQGTVHGLDGVFTTMPAGAGLPDARAYELVSPADKEDGNVYNLGSLVTPNINAIPEPFQAAPDGNEMVYEGDPSSAGNGASGNEYLATRSASGWSATDISPTLPAISDACPEGKIVNLARFEGFSENLSEAALTAVPTRQLAEETGAPNCYASVFIRDDATGGYTSDLTTAPPNRVPGQFGLGQQSGTTIGSEMFAGASADYSTQFFTADDALVSPAVDGGLNENNLYEVKDGTISAVNVLPDDTGQPDATFGAPTLEAEASPDTSHAISANGKRAVWTDLATGTLYLREDATRTIQVDASRGGEGAGGGGTFLTASTDGSRIFFTDCCGHKLTKDATFGPNLYMFEPEGEHLTDLTGNEAEPESFDEVEGVMGASADGHYVYFVATADLASGATGEGPHLYLWHDGTTRFIAALAESDNNFVLPNLKVQMGDWKGNLAYTTARVTPDGQHLVFMSHEQLTEQPTGGQDEVYTYDAESAAVTCVSCSPTGTVPTKPSVLFPSADNYSQPHWISNDGSRVFFDSEEALVPEDKNHTWDVYEYEDGAVHLISGGQASSTGAIFDDATPTGSDVFFTTRERLVVADQDDQTDLYDAREHGGFPAATAASQCAGEECRPPGSGPPAVTSPASAIVGPTGNLLSPVTPAKAITKVKVSATRAQKLAAALRACRRKPKRERGRCTRTAEARFGAHKAKKSSKRPTSATKGAAR